MDRRGGGLSLWIGMVEHVGLWTSTSVVERGGSGLWSRFVFAV